MPSFTTPDPPPIPPQGFVWIDPATGKLTPEAYRYLKFSDEALRKLLAFVRAQNP